jgi:catechol 2,3-dioxygenase-like lactoylglutathione lyase family enzyme
MSVSVNFHHIGITVSNLQRSVAFLEDAFGLKPGMYLEVDSGPETADALGLPVHKQHVALVSVGPVIMELIEFDPVRKGSLEIRQDDVGYAYPCFSVEDIDAAYDALTAKGYTINSKPQAGPDHGPVAGTKFMILKDPDGKNIEIVETGEFLVSDNIAAGEGTADPQNPVVLGKH